MFPSFLCIGAQKAGTTWLYDNIKEHPQVWMSPVKEIFYFDAKSRAPLAWQLAQPGNAQLRSHVFRSVRKRFKSGDAKPAPTPTPNPAPADDAPSAADGDSRLARALWHLRFMVLPRNDRWYESLFRPRAGQIAGDINPYLAHLSRAQVKHIHSLMPDAKIIYLIRNPVHRQWSELGMALRDRGIQGLGGLDHEYLTAQLTEASQTWLARYIGNLATWQAEYPEDQIKVGFFDQLSQDPAGLLRELYRFIGIDHSDAVIPQSVREKRNASGGPDIPERYARLLAELFLPELEELHGHFDNPYTERWLREARESLAANGAPPKP